MLVAGIQFMFHSEKMRLIHGYVGALKKGSPRPVSDIFMKPDLRLYNHSMFCFSLIYLKAPNLKKKLWRLFKLTAADPRLKPHCAFSSARGTLPGHASVTDLYKTIKLKPGTRSASDLLMRGFFNMQDPQLWKEFKPPIKDDSRLN